MLVTTLTKKMSEDLTDYLLEAGVRARYLHSEIDTLERIQIIRELRLGEYDVLVGINLLREGLDLPEVSLVAILDADKEGFLRGKTALVQTIGRAARNVNGRVLLYADKMTEAIKGAMEETERRRAIQLAYNEEHGTTPISIMKGVSDIAEFLSLENPNVPGRRRRGAQADVEGLSREELEKLAVTLEEEMFVAAEELRFEYAAKLRDEIKELRRELARARGARQLGGQRHVPEHQSAAQLRARRDARGGRGGGAAVRPQDQRLDEAVEGERGCVRARRRRGHGARGGCSLARHPRRRATARSRPRRRGPAPPPVSPRLARCSARCSPCCLRPDHRAARALRRPGKDPLKLWQTILLGISGSSSAARRGLLGHRRRRHDRAGEALRRSFSLAAIVLLILYRKFVQKRPSPVPTRASRVSARACPSGSGRTAPRRSGRRRRARASPAA